MLAKKNRLTKNTPYYVRNGKKYYDEHIYLSYIPSTGQESQIGFIVTKKVGDAVERNRFKRQMRAIMREFLPNLTKQACLIFISNTKLGKWDQLPPYQVIKDEMIKLLKLSSVIN